MTVERLTHAVIAASSSVSTALAGLYRLANQS